MRVYGLEESEDDPSVHCDEMQILGDGTIQNWRADSTHSQNHDFEWMRVLSRETKWCRVFVVQFVNVLVERTVVQTAMSPIVEGILHDEEQRNLTRHGKE